MPPATEFGTLEILTAMPEHIRSLPPSKKREVKDDAGFGTSVKRLEDDITRAIPTNASLNSLADLLDLVVGARDAQNTSKAIYALYRVFVQLITNNKLALKNKEKIRARIVLKLLFFCSHSDLAYFFRITDPLFTSEM